MKRVTLRELISELTTRLDEFSHAELKDIILEHAKMLESAERQVYLDIFVSSRIGKGEKKPRRDEKALLDEISSFGKRVENYEYSYGWGWDPEIRDERVWGDESWLYEFDKLVEEIDEFYEAGNSAFARKAYEKLLNIYYGGLQEGQLPGYDHGRMMKTDFEEVSLRYLRSVYLTEKPRSRPNAIFGTISNTYNSSLYTIRGMVNVSLEDLPELNRFGEEWIAYLKKQEGDATVTRLLKEAVSLFEGPKGLEALAREMGQQFPGAFVEWLEVLRKKEKYEEMVDAAMLGLRSLPDNLAIRARIADYLLDAARRLERSDLADSSLKEALHASPSLSRLLDLLDSAQNEKQRMTLIDNALSRFDEVNGRIAPSKGLSWISSRSPDLKENCVPHNLEIYCHLLKGDYPKVETLMTKSEPLGWSYGGTLNALAVPFFLYAFWNQEKRLSANMADLWHGATDTSTGSLPRWGNGFYDEDEDVESEDLGSRFRRHLENSLNKHPMPREDLERCFKSAEKAAKERVSAIVENKLRKSYWKAAQLILAVAETYWSRGGPAEGQRLIDHFQEKYKRHSAFRRELRTMAAKSGVFSTR